MNGGPGAKVESKKGLGFLSGKSGRDITTVLMGPPLGPPSVD